ncbi:MAG: FAD-dependent thymidylate synthase [SAR324 cluster bacterium]|nr:FAD-dependent thymidylate synthase [SAR324 cluster bacterium]
MSKGAGRFTPQEKELLAPYVTNMDGPVFALTNLPEVVKGALFSRYSRSTLGLRELLLKEFIEAPDAELAAIEGGTRGGQGAAVARESQLAVERAQDFYDRILDGYGDDSIGELGGAHLAIENVSMIATKVLQDARIGGSPLEKSTRYVSFAEKQEGDFLFYKEPRLMASPHRDAYLEINRALFETYRDLIPPMMAFIESETPRSTGVSQGAYNRSVRARALDALRGLLPASTVTNMGIFGNGRFFESLLVKLRLATLAELRELAEAMGGELGKIIPSFIRRASTEHHHFEGFREFDAAQQSALSNLVQSIPAGDPPKEPNAVDLVEHDPHAEARVLAALAFPETELPLAQLREWAAGMPEAARAAIFEDLADLRGNRRHKPPRALEMVYYTFDLLGDFGMYRDMHRHRMLTQSRQLLSTRWGYEMSEELRAAGLAGPFEKMMDRAAAVHESISADYPSEAQYVVPMAYRIRWFMRINLRALMWLVELRSSPQGHPAYRSMAQQMYLRVREVHPHLAAMMRFVNLEDYPLGRLGAEQRQEGKGQ